MDIIQKMVLIFLVTQLLGLFVGVNLIEFSDSIPEVAKVRVSPVDEDSYLNAFLFIGYVLFGAVLILLVIKYYKGELLFKLLEFAVISSASTIVFYVFLLFLLTGNNSAVLLVIAMLAGILFALAKFFIADMKNMAAMVSSSGVGAVFGYSVGLAPLIVFAVFLSVYDYFAVFISKHMITLAKSFSSKNLSFSVTAKSGETKEIKVKEQKTKKMKKMIVPKQQIELGTGDLVIPLMLAVSSYKVFGIYSSVSIVLASLIGLIFTLWYVKEKRAFLPALPPLVIPAILVILIYYGFGLIF